jgi:hypothetical protein
MRGVDTSASVQNPVVLDTRLDIDNASSFNSVNSDSIPQHGTRKVGGQHDVLTYLLKLQVPYALW